MDDIVTKLRRIDLFSESSIVERICVEAADEIERLQTLAAGIAVLREHLPHMTPEERKDMRDLVIEGYCMDCMEEEPKRGCMCQYWNDE